MIRPNYIFSVLALIAVIAFSVNTNVNAQSAEEVEQLMGGGEEAETEEAPKKEKEKKDKKAKEEAIEKAVGAEEPAVTAAPKAAKSTNPFAKPLKTWSISVVPGVVHPFTDIKYQDFFGTSDPKNENQFGIHANVMKMLGGAFGLQGSFLYGTVSGVIDSNMNSINDFEDVSDVIGAANADRGVYFQSTVMQGSLNLYWNVSNTVFNLNRYKRAQMNNSQLKERKVSFYTYAGLSLSSFDTKVMFVDDDSELTDEVLLAGDDSKATEVVMPVGLGLKFKLSNSFDIGLDASYHKLFSDKLDRIEADLPNKPKRDGYSHIGLAVTWKIGGKNLDDKSLEWHNPTGGLYDEVASLNDKVKKLSMDTDQDGVPDVFDAENDTPEGVVVDGSGKALDIDGDGVPDHADLQPFTDPDAITDEFGQAVDSDADGVPDNRDMEPNTKPGSLVNFEGISILDKVGSKGSAVSTGMPSVFFDLNSTTIKREWEDEIYQVARMLLKDKDMVVKIVGFADPTGNEQYNFKLGERRAESVYDYLVENYDIAESQLIIDSKGENAQDGKRHNINRRVDFEVMSK